MITQSGSPSLVALDESLAIVITGWVGTRADVILFAGPSLPWPLSAADLIASTHEPGRVVYVLVDDEREPVATGSLLEFGSTTRIGRVLVAPTRRGEGWGRMIMTALIKQAAEREGVRTITLGVYEHNHAARRLYQQLGLMETETRSQVTVDDETWTSLELILPLRPATESPE